MDAGGTGALIGGSVIVGIGICTKIYDLWKQRHQAKSRKPTIETPLIPMIESPLRIVRQHSKINMILPK